MSKSSHAFAGAFDIENGEPVITIRLTRQSVEEMLRSAEMDDNVQISLAKWRKIVDAIDDNGVVSDFMEAVFTQVENVIY